MLQIIKFTATNGTINGEFGSYGILIERIYSRSEVRNVLISKEIKRFRLVSK